MRHRPIALAALALSALLAACGNVTQSPAPTSTATGATSTTPGTSPGQASTIRAYFGLGSTSGNPILAPVERPAPAEQDTKARATAAIAALVAGPVEAELRASPAMFTAVPPDTALQGLQIDSAGIATVDLSEAFQEPDELPALRTALGQVVVTLTQFPEVTAVNVTINGAVLEQTDPSGHQLDGPATRPDYADQLGPIFVDDPAWGSTLHSPIHLAGLADVFEAQFGFRLLDADGRSLASGQLTASCGTGCLGSYGVSVPYNVPASTAGRLQVFDLSEADGSMQDLVEYPVTLLP
jgi:spore germination protein GerM